MRYCFKNILWKVIHNILFIAGMSINCQEKNFCFTMLHVSSTGDNPSSSTTNNELNWYDFFWGRKKRV